MSKKYVVFDLDETLGYFTELSIIWGCLQTIHDIKGQSSFNRLCQTFEKEYFRPGIFKVFQYLNKKSAKVVLYTNNTGSIQWLKMILSFMEERSNTKGLFVEIVPGYKPGMKGPCARESFNKTYPEILRCAKLPANAKLIFFDDQPHPGMQHQNVKYIRVRPYLHPIRASQIIAKLQHSYFSFLDFGSHSYIYKCIRNFHQQYAAHGYRYGNTRVSETDIITPLRKFLMSKTQKNRKHSKNKTLKHNE